MSLLKHIPVIFALSVIMLTSCKSYKDGQIYQNLEGQDIEVGLLEDEDLSIEIAYVGAIGHSYIFECAVTNLSDQAIIMDKDQFAMTINGSQTLYPIVEEEVVSGLKNTSKSLKSRRKTDTALGILGIGISVLAGAASGVSVGDALLTNAEPIIYIMDDRRWYKKNIESVDDEIEYVRSAQFNEVLIQPNATIVRDILFPTTKIDGDVEITLYHNEEEYIISFPRDTFV